MYPVNFPGATEIKKPANMTDEECMSIWASYGFDTLFRMMQLGPMLPAGIESAADENKYSFYLTAWMPNKEDRDAINEGRPIFVKTLAHALPPMSVFTLDESDYPNYPKHVSEMEILQEKLREWKELFQPLFEYVHNHPESLAGDSITQFILHRAKKFDVLQRSDPGLEQLMIAADEREVLAQAFDRIQQLFTMRSWIMEGRGLYPYDDDRYKEEVRNLFNDFDLITKHTWKNIKTKSADYRKWIIEEYLSENTSLPKVPSDKFSSSRYKCSCDPSIRNDDEKKYAQQVTLDLPKDSLAYRNRIDEALSPNICIDSCIVDAIKELWKQEIETVGCCCGHNAEPAWVQVHPADYAKMFELGYEQKPVYMVNGSPHGLYSFYL